MKYRCLVFDHDDTIVNSTASIHHPCFQAFLDQYRPGQTCTFDEYIIKNFSPGFVQMCREDYALSNEELDIELAFWKNYVQNHTPVVFPGIRDIMQRQKADGGLVCVVSHSLDVNILRDFVCNHLPEPDAVYGWERPPEQRKPNPFPMEDIIRRFSLSPDEVLMIDDLKPGYDMAKSCGVDFAAAGWAYRIPKIEDFMRRNSDFYFASPDELASFII
ncbi:MAG: HAD hydrolase-like protein [Oscillospiraceae bacterium]|nr:HAD hydrolase-like protein [Oscillospiraceae bacterium]